MKVYICKKCGEETTSPEEIELENCPVCGHHTFKGWKCKPAFSANIIDVIEHWADVSWRF